MRDDRSVKVSGARQMGWWVRLTVSSGCHKGKRECVYSEPSSGSKSKASKTAKGKRKDGSPISDDDAEDGDETRRLGAIEESESSSPGESPEGAEQTSTHSKSMRDRKNSSGTPSLTTDGASPSTEDSPYSGSGASPRDHLEGKAAASRLHDDRLDAAALPPDVKFYLKYYVNEVTYHHYSMKADVDHILHNDLLTQAFRYDPLLQAITGFAAFHHTIRNPSGTIKDFLQYYNKAVTLLLRSLRTGKEMTVGTLLCMLQLAAIEVGTERKLPRSLKLISTRSYSVTGSTFSAIREQPAPF